MEIQRPFIARCYNYFQRNNSLLSPHDNWSSCKTSLDVWKGRKVILAPHQSQFHRFFTRLNIEGMNILEKEGKRETEACRLHMFSFLFSRLVLAKERNKAFYSVVVCVSERLKLRAKRPRKQIQSHFPERQPQSFICMSVELQITSPSFSRKTTSL